MLEARRGRRAAGRRHALRRHHRLPASRARCAERTTLPLSTPLRAVAARRTRLRAAAVATPGVLLRSRAHRADALRRRAPSRDGALQPDLRARASGWSFKRTDAAALCGAHHVDLSVGPESMHRDFEKLLAAPRSPRVKHAAAGRAPWQRALRAPARCTAKCGSTTAAARCTPPTAPTTARCPIGVVVPRDCRGRGRDGRRCCRAFGAPIARARRRHQPRGPVLQRGGGDRLLEVHATAIVELDPGRAARARPARHRARRPARRGRTAPPDLRRPTRQPTTAARSAA